MVVDGDNGDGEEGMDRYGDYDDCRTGLAHYVCGRIDTSLSYHDGLRL